MIIELQYTSTNTYLIKGETGNLLFDTGWAGTFNLFCKAMGEAGESVQDIDYILISHYRPDHMGIAQEIADAAGTRLVIMDVQESFTHNADSIFIEEYRFEKVKNEIR